MKELLINLLLYLLGKLGYEFYAANIAPKILLAAEVATAEAERKGGAKAGEAKRAQALRMMLNLVPDASHRDIALAIELCLPH